MEQANKTATTPRKTKSKAKVVIRSNRDKKKEKMIARYKKTLSMRMHSDPIPIAKNLLPELTGDLLDTEVVMARDAMIEKQKKVSKLLDVSKIVYLIYYHYCV